MKDWIEKQISQLKHKRQLKGPRIRYIYNRKAGCIDVWEEDAWGRRHRAWKVRDIPWWDFEDKPTEEQSRYEKERVKERNIHLHTFMRWIGEDYYNIRDTWARQARWNWDRLLRFEEWLEQIRWHH